MFVSSSFFLYVSDENYIPYLSLKILKKRCTLFSCCFLFSSSAEGYGGLLLQLSGNLLTFFGGGVSIIGFSPVFCAILRIWIAPVALCFCFVQIGVRNPMKFFRPVHIGSRNPTTLLNILTNMKIFCLNLCQTQNFNSNLAAIWTVFTLNFFHCCYFCRSSKSSNSA